mmetsp:Transcript_20375/g.81468  ORF Transcript_20375/g.81468 Transcript_20375/m.81468 type:complete len:252 (-) Transcript_20375:430-1185(-)
MRSLSLSFRTRLPPRFFLPARMSGAGSALTCRALGGSQSFSILALISSRNAKPDDVSRVVFFCEESSTLVFSEPPPNASTRTASEALAATSLRHLRRSGAGAAWTRSVKNRTPVCGIWTALPNPPKSPRCPPFAWPMTTKFAAGTAASASKPPAMPTSIAASDDPTRTVRFGASTAIRDSKYDSTAALSCSSATHSAHPRTHASKSVSVNGTPDVVEPVTETTMTTVGGSRSERSRRVMSVSFRIASTTRT